MVLIPMVVALSESAPSSASSERTDTATTPTFKAPFECGTVWGASTYAGHGNAVDFNDPAGAETDFGKPVLASAAGTATSGVDPVGGNYVIVDHGGGWSTYYGHLDQILVTNPVAVGQQLGTVGHTGSATGSHLHYEQRLNGTGQLPILFDGAAIAVGDSPPGPTFTSTNCDSDPEGVTPVGAVDSVEVTGTRVRVRGWALDEDVPQDALTVRLSTGEPGTEGDVRELTADASRPDVAAAYPGAGEAHGFDVTLPLERRGTVEVSVTALNAEGTDGEDADLATKTVTVAPVEEEMIRARDGGTWWVHLGRRYRVPSSTVTACLGGTDAVHPIDIAARDALPDSGERATCEGRLIAVEDDQAVWWLRRGERYEVPSYALGCLGGVTAVHRVTSSTRAAYPKAGSKASCEGAMIQVEGERWRIRNGARSRVPSPASVGCMVGGWAQVHLVGAAVRDRLRDTGDDAYCLLRSVRPASVSGPLRVGATLTAHPGQWRPTPARTGYQWFAAGHRISGATRSTLRLKPWLADKRVVVRVSLGAPAGYASKTVTVPRGTVRRQ